MFAQCFLPRSDRDARKVLDQPRDQPGCIINIVALLLGRRVGDMLRMKFLKQDSEVLIAINSQGLYVIDPVNVVSHEHEGERLETWYF